ncbi:helix-turn-helix domain-containing protein [Brevundimonas balnearis]|uniref:Helix-turn-helix domain-containing protein n=1 Tax=Brevundimonas balnearis TaxID=1572858 RepID=A0ABV6R352_9CAUL
MARFDPKAAEELARLAAALADLRRRQGLSQAEAGAAVGMTSQAWGLYEAGRRPGLFRPDVQARLTGALDLTPEDLRLALARVGGEPDRAPATGGVEAQGRTFTAAAPPTLRRLQLDDDRLAPWAVSGVVIEYAPGRWPRRDQGCVVETADGRLMVRLYDGADADVVRLRGGAGLTEVETLRRADLRGVHAVVARIDP